ncbi:hypothetical protein [Thermomonas sp.]|uniref:hypothetical protein n=1 Tax=Thermomonas sp. TaxID=1971895 RepID=UPI0035B01D5B
MNKLLFVILLMPGLTHAGDSASDSPEARLITELRADAAKCSIDGQLAALEVPANASAKRIQQAGEVGLKCEAEMREKVKPLYRSTLEQAPDSRPQLTAMYAKWLNYLQALGNPFAQDEHRRAGEAFEAAIADLGAELDARPTSP